ncbi:hypothetical protein D3C72_876900 [compost metagenome]
MIKYTLALFTALALVFTYGYSQTSMLYISFNPTNCIKCLKSLDRIKKLDELNIPYSFVISEKFKDDAEYFKKELKLSQFKGEILFSDSTYNLIKGYLTSGISLVNSDNDSIQHFDFENLEANISKLLCLSRTVDTINFPASYLSPSAEVIKFHAGKIYYVNAIKKTSVFVVDIYNKSIDTIQLRPEIILNNLSLYFKKKNYKVQETLQLQFPEKNSISNFLVLGDTLILLSDHHYIDSIIGKDTAIGKFTAINIFYKNKYLNSKIVDANIKEGSYFPISSFSYSNGKYMFGIIGGLKNNIPQHFIAEYNNIDNRSIQFNKLSKSVLPKEYSNIGYLFANPYFQNQYVLLPLSNVLYNIYNETEIILNGFTVNNIPNKQLSLEQLNKNFGEFRVSKNKGWFLHMNPNEMYCRLAVYNFNAKKIEYDYKVPNSYLPALIDDFDPNYLIQPLNSKQLVRYHIKNLQQ